MTTPATTLKTLYLCYFGLREPLVQTQVLPYLRELHRGGVEVHLLTFEPNRRKAWSKEDERAWRERLASEGIRWHALAYHKSPSVVVTPYDIVRGAWLAARLARTHRIDVLHARGHLPMAMALLARRIYGRVRLLFDIRGLLAEEYEEAGVWTKDSPQYRAVQAVERAGLKRSAQLIVLTRRMRDLLVERRLARAEQIEVVPCCVDFARFDAAVTRNGDGAAQTSVEKKNEHAPRVADEETRRFEIVTAGSVTGLYLLEEMGRFFLALKRHRPDAFLRVLTTSNAADATATLERTGLERADFWVGAARPAEVPAFLRRARLGLSFRKATFSQIAASPTKIPEYLAAGLPTVCNSGIGDTDDILTRERVGIIVGDFAEETLDEAARAALALAAEQGISERAIETAHRYFDLAGVGGVGYRNAYRRLAAETAGAPVMRETT
ncbi:MAG TPA: glycosyltransferase [Pyrinomonadaceae bacterium]|nr:glycosyltransferase [Pyrinomonadaceae bacterium]